MRVARPGAFNVLLPKNGNVGGGLEADAAHGRTAPSAAVLRVKETGMELTAKRLCGGAQTRTAPHAADGDRGDLPTAADERTASGPSHLPLFAAGLRGFRGGPGVERGHHLRANAARIHVFGCN